MNATYKAFLIRFKLFVIHIYPLDIKISQILKANGAQMYLFSHWVIFNGEGSHP